MIKVKHIFIILILAIFMVTSGFSQTFATWVDVTDENLNASLQKFVSSSDNDKHYKITVDDNKIKINSDDGDYILKYDLTNNPTFTYEVDIQKGMSYKEFQEKTGNTLSTFIGYIGVADVQGVNYKDSSTYFMMQLLSAFSNAMSNGVTNPIVIVDDTQMSEGVTIEKKENDPNTIYVSEFGDRVMEYVNSLYEKKQTFKDTTDGYNTFEMTTEKSDVTQTSCKLLTTLSVNKDADFSKLIGYEKQVDDIMEDSFSIKDSEDTAKTSTIPSSTTTTTPTTSTRKSDLANNTSQKTKQKSNSIVLPKTGKEQGSVFAITCVLMIFASISVVISIILIKRYN